MTRSRITRISTALAVAALLAVSLPSAAGAAPGRSPEGRTAGARPAAACARGSKACPIRIVFRPGAYSGSARSTLMNQGQERWFSVRATKGQTMIVVIIGAGPTGGTLTFPNGTQDGGPGGRVFDGEVPASGVTKIRVTESLMANSWAGRVTVIVMIY